MRIYGARLSSAVLVVFLGWPLVTARSVEEIFSTVPCSYKNELPHFRQHCRASRHSTGRDARLILIHIGLYVQPIRPSLQWDGWQQQLKFSVLFSRFATAKSEQSINKRYTAVAVVIFNIFP
jgi:hypothetical protein